VYAKNGNRLPIDGEVEVIHREKLTHKVAIGWSYRFKSGETWMLLPIDQVDAWVFDDKPEGR
jgi:hypothetical protein